MFEALMLASIALNAVYLYLGSQIAGEEMGSGRVLLLHVLCLVAALVLTLAVSRGRSNVAKWLLILLLLLCLAASLTMDDVGTADIVALLLQLIAIALLFTRPAVAYLEHKPSSV